MLTDVLWVALQLRNLSLSREDQLLRGLPILLKEVGELSQHLASFRCLSERLVHRNEESSQYIGIVRILLIEESPEALYPIQYCLVAVVFFFVLPVPLVWRVADGLSAQFVFLYQ